MIAEATQVGTMPLYFMNRYRSVREPINRRKSISRNLFGKVDEAENERFLRVSNNKILDNFQNKWGFDVRTEKEVPNDRFKWLSADIKSDDKKENIDGNTEEKVSRENESPVSEQQTIHSPPASTSALQRSKLKIHQHQSKMTGKPNLFLFPSHKFSFKCI